ncbi:MAG: CpsD/CapB family tyrosine-protein kinase, partial [Clostridiales bacterium]|nr:CpsD/CapB family tyrosine-protein kinase [Clostridiales bacterium]
METIDKLDAKSPIVEAYRSVRTSIEYSNLDDKLKVILVTSTQQNEGKSTVASNLAISFSKLPNKKILLIDGDLRNPSIHRVFSIGNSDGMMSILKGEKDLKSTINTFNDNLDILTTGVIPPNPDEILVTDKMKKFIQQIKEKYDYIFIDSPPIGIVSDASLLSQLSDGVIFVVSSGEVETDFAKLAKDKLMNVEAKILGAVLNKYESHNDDYGYYYSEYYGARK